MVWRLPPKIPQLWRLASSFCITGGGIGLLFDSYFLYTYSTALEKGSPRFTEHGSYFTYIMFLFTGILAMAGYGMGGMTFLQPLTLGLAYTFSQDNPNSNISIFVFNFPAKYLPYAMLFLTLVSPGGGPRAAKFQVTGLIAAHLYDFLTRIWPTFGGGRNWVQTPGFVRRWFTPEGSSTQQRSYGTVIQPRQAAPPTGSSGNSWSNQRGPGRRLGD